MDFDDSAEEQYNSEENLPRDLDEPQPIV